MKKSEIKNENKMDIKKDIEIELKKEYELYIINCIIYSNYVFKKDYSSDIVSKENQQYIRSIYKKLLKEINPFNKYELEKKYIMAYN
jgi:hypothetical protein